MSVILKNFARNFQMPSFPNFRITQQQIKEINAISQIKEEILKVPTFQSDIPQWNFTDIVCEMLYQFADMVSNVPNTSRS